MEQQRKVIFLRLMSFTLFFIFGLNIILRDYLNVSYSHFIVLGLFIVDGVIGYVGYNKVSNELINLTLKDEQVNKSILLVLVFLFIGNFILVNQYEDAIFYSFIIGVLLIIGSIIGSITQYIILKRN